MGHSMTGGGEGPSVAEVAASLPARLLGAMEELKSSENQTKKKEEKEIFFSLKIRREVILSLSAQSGFYKLKIA